ncbi:electron transport complex subunit RsxG [Psychromonas algicola]|uniref:electron transport complex subunit RsxG n=1 Tax=Psychromonas algicola TaxID=2555642 RepID=UPI0032637AF5
MMGLSISRNAMLLGLFAVICTGAIAVINLVTKPLILKQEQIALQNNINELITIDRYDNNIIDTCFLVVDENLLGNNTPKQVYVATKNDQPVAALIQTSTLKGYSGEIKLLVGIDSHGEITGVRVNSHTETPGLGDKIQTNKSDWILSFDGKTYQAEQDKIWDVKKDGGNFDAFTGATITPRAVIHSVKDALIYFQKNKQQLFSTQPNCGEQ